MTVQTQARSLSSASAQDALRYLSTPSAITMPILPDIPEPVATLTVDAVPDIDGPPPEIVIKVEPVRSVAKFVTVKLPRDMARITGNALNLRSGPGMRTPSIGSLARGATVRITGSQRGKWIPVEVAANGQRGWVFHKFVRRVN